ncbi:MAG: Do family serine endopeptidase [Pseudomonadota bacterium]
MTVFPWLRTAPIAALALAASLIAVSGPAEARLPIEGFADLAEELTPMAVAISTAQTVDQPARPGPEISPDNPFGEFFRDFFDRRGGGAPRRMESQGSGFVIDAEGYIVTNNHVIEGAEDIVVEFSDGKTYDAELMGADPQTDIALLKIEPDRDLAVAPFGDSDQVRVGDLVLAIGNPFGQGFSVSSGIISALDRDINAGRYDRFLQTDAAINRGNSGGPLFNMKGEVIGVNTAIISPTGGSIGIGFAVPSSLAQSVIEQLRTFGETRRGWLGVLIQEVDDAIASSIGLDRAYGAMVNSVEDESPAAAAGVLKGDIILRFNGSEVSEMRDLPRLVAETPVGEVVTVEVFRSGEVEALDVEIALLDESRLAGGEAETSEEETSEAEPETMEMLALGLGFQALDETTRSRFSIADELTEGVVIATVDETSAAYEKGLRPGDVLVEVQQDAVSTPDEAIAKIEAARELDRNAVLLMVARGASRRFVAVEFER